MNVVNPGGLPIFIGMEQLGHAVLVQKIPSTREYKLGFDIEAALGLIEITLKREFERSREGGN